MLGRGRSYVWLLAGLLAIIAGFWPSFYGDPLGNDAWHIAHAIAATLWVVLLITQSLLIGRGNRQLHERLGWLSLGLFATLFATTCYMMWVELTGPQPFPAVVRQALLFLNVTFLTLFVVLYASGIAFRRTRRLHTRLMGSTILIGLGPALVRLYGHQIPALDTPGSVILTFATIEIILVAAIVIAFRHDRHVRPFPEILVAFVLIQAGLPWATGPTFAGVLRALGSPI